jgi:hypothetical protein
MGKPQGAGELKTRQLDSPEAVARMRVSVGELREILLKDSASDPQAEELLAEIKNW